MAPSLQNSFFNIGALIQVCLIYKFMFVSFFYFRRENYINIWFHCCGIIFNYKSHYFEGGLVGTFSIQVGSKASAFKG